MLILFQSLLGAGPALGSVASLVTFGFGSAGRMQATTKLGYSSYIGLPEPPPTGKQYQVGAEGAGWSVESLGWGQTPAIVSGDIVITPLLTPSGYPLTCPADAIVSYLSGGDETRQLIVYDWFDISTLAFRGEGVFAVNNEAPLAGDTTLIFAFPLGIPITQVDLSAYFPDAESDPVTVTAIDPLPPGYSLVASQLGGTPTIQDIDTVRFQGTDPYGALSNSLTVILISGNVVVPDVDNPGTTRSTAEGQITAAYLNFLEVEIVDAAPIDEVVSQSPAPETQVAPFSTVTIFVSLGQAPQPTVVTITVQAIQNGFYGGLYRYKDDTFDIAFPEEYSPYWMEFIDTPPTDWLPYLAVFDPYIDREMLEFGIPVE